MSGYSSVITPDDEPVPRTSSRSTANPAAAYRSYVARYDEVTSSFRYGSASIKAAYGPSPWTSGSGRNSVPASRSPSTASILTSRAPTRTTVPPVAVCVISAALAAGGGPVPV